MILFSGQDILRKWVIVKGKRVFNLLSRDPYNHYDRSDHYDWSDHYSHNVKLFNSQQEAQEFINKKLPVLKKFKDAHVKLLTINIS